MFPIIPISKVAIFGLVVENAFLVTAAPQSRRVNTSREGFDSSFTDYALAGEHQTAIPYGRVINSCVVPNTIALTFDDGPSGYSDEDLFPRRTIDVLDILKDNDIAATFFLAGSGRFEHSEEMLRRMVDEGHQIGHHTMSHPHLTELDRDGVVREMRELEDVFISHLGFAPTYMRLPFLDGNREVLSYLNELKYHVIGLDLDTSDWQYNDEVEIQKSINRFNQGVGLGSRLVLAHEKHEWTVEKLLPEMLKTIKEQGLQTVTVGECLGDGRENWYRRVPTGSKSPSE